tara:strand:- start:2301 stop:3284 length:984 start_codon:yes stop_codon:yes gene_type:complete
MPKGSDWFNLIYVTVAYLSLAGGLVLYISLNDIYLNWPKYRCNPLFLPLSKNIRADFTYCIQNMQAAYMGTLLKPIWWLISNIGELAGNVFGTLQNVRMLIARLRGFLGSIITTIMGFILNFVIQAQKMAIAIKDTVGKVIAIMLTLLYLMDGTMKTMQSAWNGPPGQITRAICFRKTTLVVLKDGTKKKIKDVCLGDVLRNGSKVVSTMKILNDDNQKFYKFKSKDDGKWIYVTGSHYVRNDETGKYVFAKNHPQSILTDKSDEKLCCLITDDHRIEIGGITFWDWEDQHLLQQTYDVNHFEDPEYSHKNKINRQFLTKKSSKKKN